MPDANFYPPLKQILPKVDLPVDVQLIDSFIATIFDNLYYKNLIAERSKLGDAGFLKFDLVTYKRIGYTIPGTNGLTLLFNPELDENGVAFTSIPLSFEYQLEIVKYINGLSPSNFQADPIAYFNLLLEIVDLSVGEILQQTIEALIGGELDPVEEFITNFNNSHGSGGLIERNSGQSDNDFVDMAIQMADLGFDTLTLIYEDYISGQSIGEVFDRLKLLFKKWFNEIDLEEAFNKLFTPFFKVSLDGLGLGLEFPESILKPVTPGSPGEKTILEFNVGSLSYDSENGFQFDSVLSFDLPPSYILGTEFSLSANDLKLDLSQVNNIPEAIADGRPADFIGVYISEGSIGFPTDWGHNSDEENQSSGELYVNNLLVGTGGISGTIGMRAIDPVPVDEEEEEEVEEDKGLIQLKFGQDFKATLKDFNLEFQQNAIISSDIHGTLQIPGFEDPSGGAAIIDINVHIGQDGEFNVVASAVPALKVLRVPGAFDFYLESVFFGREEGDDGRFYLGIGGKIDFTLVGVLDQFLPDKLDIKKMLIYDDGTFEFEGGKIVLPKAYELTFGVATISVTGIHSGTYDKDGRNYKYFGFDGGVKTTPSGVDAHGKGIKFFYTNDEQPFDWFMRLESLKVEIVVPSGSTPEEAAVAISGFLSISEPKIPVIVPPEEPLTPEFIEVLKNSQEYAGGVKVSIPKFKGLKASAAMRLNPKVPSFIVDLELEISKPILLGTTGLGIYGFRALLGKKYVATKSAAGIPEDGLWWQYYKAKIDPDFKEGIQVSKFDNKNGFSLGAGVSLATASDSGKIFSSKLFFLLSLPDVFLFQGQAQFLKERIGIDANPDPPFYAIIAITKHSIEAGFGVNYKLREEGKLVTVDGVIELGFFWGSSSSWYVNVGRETPEDRRIQARLFDILNMYFYLMMSSGGIRLGAGVKFELSKKFGPLSAELKAYIDTFGKISKRPRQIGGAIKMGGTVGIKVCGFGFSVSGGATLAAEAPKPHIVTGEFEVCVKVLKKERCARFEFTWTFDTNLDMVRVPLLGGTVGESNTLDERDASRVARTMHMVTGETQALAYRQLPASATGASLPAPDEWITDGADDFRIPMDSFIDIEFKKGMNVSGTMGNNLGRIGGLSSPAKFVEFVPPVRAKSDRVRHEYYLDDIEIVYWDETTTPKAWRPYDFYAAMQPVYEGANAEMGDALASAIIEATETTPGGVLNDLKWGYWQQQEPGVNNKLRILATTPLSYTADTGSAYTIEDLGVNDGTIFCGGDKIPQTCVIFGDELLYSAFPAGTLRSYQNVTFRVTSKNGVVANFAYSGFDNCLVLEPGNTVEIFFSEPMKEVSLLLRTGSPEVEITYYRRRGSDTAVNGLTSYEYDEIDSTTIDEIVENRIEIDYASGEDAIDYIKIATNSCTGTTSLLCTPAPDLDDIARAYSSFITQLVTSRQIDDASVELFPAYEHDYGDFFVSALYGREPKDGDTIMLTQGYLSPMGVSFTITDNYGFECLYTLEMRTPVEDFEFSQITSIISIDPYTADDHTGANNNFLVVFDIGVGGLRKTVEFIGTTCKTLSYCVDSCSTGLYKVCYLSLENDLSNQTIPDTEAQQGANNVLFESINGTLQPVWRPNTAFAIRLKTSDKIGREGNAVETTWTDNSVYGFRTAGPVGHYHRYPVSLTQEEGREDYKSLDKIGKADEFRLTTLKSYIDYDKSYPNADSTLSNAKPLFYINAKLRLFYLYNHVYQFYSDWSNYDHVTLEPTDKLAESSLEVRIQNPAPAQQNPDILQFSGFEANRISHASPEGTPPANIHSVNSEISLLNNLLINGNPCADYTPLAPIDVSTSAIADLKPLKLYTAQFIARYNARLNGGFAEKDFESVVHSYVFQTSRYADFTQQVMSYVLRRDEEDDSIVREAVYRLNIAEGFDHGLAEKAVRNMLTELEDGLKQQYADPFERVIYGVLGMDINELQTARTTEFNLVMAGDKLAGILIRNPEPFNNPKIPKADQELIQLIDPNSPITDEDDERLKVTLKAGFLTGTNWTNFYVIHSKDHSQMFVTPGDFLFDMALDTELQFTFTYKEYTGLVYEDISTVIVPIDLTNHI